MAMTNKQAFRQAYDFLDKHGIPKTDKEWDEVANESSNLPQDCPLLTKLIMAIIEYMEEEALTANDKSKTLPN